MFSRVASAARGPLRRVATRGLSVGAAATASSSNKLSFVAGGAVVLAAGLTAIATQQQDTPTQCAASIPYVGVPGTANERTFIVSRRVGARFFHRPGMYAISKKLCAVQCIQSSGMYSIMQSFQIRSCSAESDRYDEPNGVSI